MTTDQPAASSPTVLIVDDNDLIRSMCELALSRFGYSTVTATSVDDAIVRLAEHPDVSVVISDVSMPGDRDGTALLDELRSSRPALGLIVMSGDPDAGARRLTDVRTLSKPFTLDQLTDAVAAVLPDAARSPG